ncbi:MAG: enoyl-CoA hydratase/isomerase family protein [Candidatus Dormibacteria bacterium]
MASAATSPPAAPTARLGQVVPRMGPSVDLCGSRIVPRLVGPHLAQELSPPGRELSGEECRPACLASRAVSPEALDRVGDRLGPRLAAGPKIANPGTNRLLGDSSSVALPEALDGETIAGFLNVPEPDLAESLAALSRRR